MSSLLLLLACAAYIAIAWVALIYWGMASGDATSAGLRRGSRISGIVFMTMLIALGVMFGIGFVSCLPH